MSETTSRIIKPTPLNSLEYLVDDDTTPLNTVTPGAHAI